MWRAMLLASVLVLAPAGVLAQEKQDDKEIRLKALEERVRQLEEMIRLIRAERVGDGGVVTAKLVPAVERTSASAANSAGASPTPPQDPQAAPVQAVGGAGALAKALNPDISLIGDFLGAIGRNTIRTVPALELHEAELGLQAIIDPYMRGDVFLAFSPEGVEIEEAFVTFTSLPKGLRAKAGKMRAEFGKVNAIHNHALAWTDRPLVTENLVNGEEGIGDAGVSLSRILPAPRGVFLEATAQVYRGNSGELFTTMKNSDVSVVGRLRGYGDLSESSNVDLGFSFARGHNEVGSAFTTQLYGVDATFRWKPLRRAIYKSFLARAEFVWSRRQQLDSVLLPETQKAFGFYASADYRLNRRWTIGGRYDRSGRATDASLTDSGFSGLLTYWPSEFSQLRGQYRFTRYADGVDASEFRFQLLFVLGAHGAHPF